MIKYPPGSFLHSPALKHASASRSFKIHKLDTAQTPSYPSGHALQGRLIALMLSEKDPYNENQYMDISKDISESRIMARAHYPTDKDYGEKLADELFEQRIK